ncbi:MAG: DUF748 domain-containing protein [Lentisphaeria bacterium]|nr:DUF748 domain-containing protein [Lentisphaeria bacterium]
MKPWLRRIRRWAAIVALIYCVHALLVVFVVPPLARHLVQTKLGEALGRTVTVESVRLNPFTLVLRLRKLRILDRDGSSFFAGFERLTVNLQFFRSLVQRGPVVSRVLLEGPGAVVVRHADLSLNVPTGGSGPPPAPVAEKTGEPAALPRFTVENIEVREGWVFFRDEAIGACQRITGLSLTVPALSSLPARLEAAVQPELRAVLNGHELTVGGQAKPLLRSREAAMRLVLEGLDLTRFLPYLPKERNFEVRSARLDLNLTVHHVLDEGGGPSLSLSGDAALSAVRVDDRAGEPMFGLEELRISLLSTNLLRRKVHVARVAVREPFAHLRRTAEGTLVLPALDPTPEPESAPAAPAPPVPGGKAAVPLLVDIDETVVEAGRITFLDESVTPAFRTAMDLTLEARQLSTRENAQGTIHVVLTTEREEKIEGTYGVCAAPLAVSGTTALTGLQIPAYMAYLKPMLSGEIARGTFSAAVQHSLSRPVAGSTPQVSVADLDATLADVVLTAAPDGEEVCAVGEVRLEDVTCDLTAREVVVGGVSTREGRLRVHRAKDGSTNLERLLRPAAPAESTPAPLPDPAAPPAAAAEAKAWTVHLTKAGVAGWKVALTDEQPGGSVNLALHDITVGLQNLGTAPDTKGTLAISMGIGEAGMLAVEGDVVAVPPAADLRIKLDGLEMKTFQAYLARFVHLTLVDGVVSTDLHVAVDASAAEGLEGTVEGAVAVDRFVSLDSVHSREFARCGRLAVNGIRVVVRPLAIGLGEIAIDGFAGDLALGPDGSLNVMSVLRREPPVEADGPASAPPPVPDGPPAAAAGAEAPVEGGFPLEIGAVRLKDCTVAFTDQTITPHYRLSLDRIAASVRDLSLAKPTPAGVDFSARIDGMAPLSAAATLTDIAHPSTLTMQASTTLKGLDLSPLSPYSGQYVGYAIQKGKLDLDLRYAVDQRKLAAEHVVLIDQFSFGSKVDSPKATDLPVRLAVALLKDRKGQIRLDVPVRGDLDDPTFSVLRIVLKVVRDLVAKAATAPFALLGSLVGGGSGEELSFVVFAPGGAEVDEAGATKLGTLAKALAERPELGVEICGSVDPEEDRAALARMEMLRRARARKLADLVKEGRPAVPVDEVTMAPEETERYLRLLYADAAPPTDTTPTAPPPARDETRGQEGDAATVPAPDEGTPRPEPPLSEVERVLLGTIDIGDQEVQSLARARAARVQEFLVREGKIEAARVFVVERLDAQASGAVAAAPLRRVQLSLR